MVRIRLVCETDKEMAQPVREKILAQRHIKKRLETPNRHKLWAKMS